MSPTSKKKNPSTRLGTPPARKITPRVLKSIEIKPSKPTALPNPSLRLYRSLAGGFIAVVALMLIVVVLLSTTKAIVRVTPKIRTVETSFLFDVVKEAAAEGQILGTVVEQTFEQAKTFPIISGEAKEILDKSGGTVVIFNKSSKTQPLVATTRLLSSGGVLFRLDKGVTVPAGGQVEALVHADQIGSTGDINPDKFTIPGLATSLQTQIYAESSVAMTGGKKMVSVVTQEELDADVEKLNQEMETFAQEQLRLAGQANWNSEAFVSEILTKTSDTQPGEEKDNVIISLKIKVAGVFFDTEALNGLISAKSYENLSEGFVFKDSDGGSLTLEVVSVDNKFGLAEMRAIVSSEAVVSNTHQLLQPEVLVGKTAAEAKSYLLSAGLADDVSVWVFPPWVRKIPAMVDHVTVQVLE